MAHSLKCVTASYPKGSQKKLSKGRFPYIKDGGAQRTPTCKRCQYPVLWATGLIFLSPQKGTCTF